MANSKSSDNATDSEFVLKHRIAGAAFLLFFGALLLPWVLGAPDSGERLEAAIDLAKSESSVPASQQADQLAEELSAAVASEEVAIEEQVYISKITPVGSPQTSDLNSSSGQDSSDQQTVEEPAPVAAKEEAPEQSSTTASNQSSGVAQPPSQSSGNGVEPDQEIDVGWVVQVGVFTDKTGAGRVVEDLRTKGFSPSTTIVDTNRGKATGTRIWLGPYAQRVDAAKAKAELTQKTGEAGFIRAYP